MFLLIADRPFIVLYHNSSDSLHLLRPDMTLKIQSISYLILFLSFYHISYIDSFCKPWLSYSIPHGVNTSLLSRGFHIQDKTPTVPKGILYISTYKYLDFLTTSFEIICGRKNGALQTSHLLFHVTQIPCIRWGRVMGFWPVTYRYKWCLSSWPRKEEMHRILQVSLHQSRCPAIVHTVEHPLVSVLMWLFEESSSFYLPSNPSWKSNVREKKKPCCIKPPKLRGCLL